MARAFVARQMVKAGGQPIWRQDFITDNGNEIIDVHDLKIANPLEVETRFNQIPGVVTVGLFAHRARGRAARRRQRRRQSIGRQRSATR